MLNSKQKQNLAAAYTFLNARFFCASVQNLLCATTNKIAKSAQRFKKLAQPLPPEEIFCTINAVIETLFLTPHGTSAAGVHCKVVQCKVVHCKVVHCKVVHFSSAY